MALTRLFKRRESEAPAGPPRLPDNLRVYAVGDIHGCRERLKKLHDVIERDSAGVAGRKVIVYLGDYVDRGEDSAGVIEDLLRDEPAGFERIFLKGNHEDFLLRSLEDKGALLPWLANGGDSTCRAYGVEPTNPPDGVKDLLGWLRQRLGEALPERHLTFLRNLRLTHGEGDYLFVHAGVRPGVELEKQSEEDLLWMREPFLSSKQSLGKVVVHGHTPSATPERRANRIGIDTGACYGGALTALVLEGDDQRFLQA
jgi:serine/threonine protein phosphatase 1